ncbi:MAG: magnesium chelatase subunit D [Rubrivivax sp.]
MAQPPSALELFAVAPRALGGLRLRGRADAAREAWLAALRAAWGHEITWSRLPAHAGDEALHGSLDLPATLAAGRPVHTQGLLARARQGLLVVPMAERVPAALAARLALALDTDGGPPLLLLDEGLEADERPPPALLDRCALQLTLDPRAPTPAPDGAQLSAARGAWRRVRLDEALLDAVVQAAAALGVDSARGALQALVATRVVAALAGRTEATAEDAALAVQLVLAPRATRLPPSPEADDAPAEEPPEPPQSPEPPPPDVSADSAADDEREQPDPGPLPDRLVDAARSVLPEQLLALMAAGRPRRAGGDSGRSGERARARDRGHAIGSQRGQPRGGARLALVDTLRAAAPWQRLRRSGPDDTRVHVQRDELHVQKREQRRGSTTIFAIDASGSQALHRLAEAKGAVELLLADCYARRDRVAVIGFRGHAASLLLAPTRSLVRARRQLAGLPGGGGTPLAAGIDAARLLAETVARGGSSPLVVLLTDGRANITRLGEPGREQAAEDARRAARALAAGGTPAMLIDTSPQPSAPAQALAQALQARYLPLPHAGARAVSVAVRHERGSAGPGSRRG